MDLRIDVANDGVTNICRCTESTVRGRVPTGAVHGITSVTSVLQVHRESVSSKGRAPPRYGAGFSVQV
jgi:hypothetical protein